jgi:hypothetical protein
MSDHELWRERWTIVERRDGDVYRTEKLDEGWWDADQVDNNKPAETNLIYAAGGANAPELCVRKKPAPRPEDKESPNIITSTYRKRSWLEGG